MRIPRFLVTVPYLHSYDLSDIFYHNDMGMVKLAGIRFQILCVVDLKLESKEFLYAFFKKILLTDTVCGCTINI